MGIELQSARSDIERIRQAEQLIAAGNYERALEHLRAAQAAEPTNQYIPALVERTIALLYPSTVRREVASSPVQESESEASRRVQRLTLVARDLYERGSYEMAFQTLLKAFQLAPTSPYVLECQKTLAPAMELLRKRGTLSGVHVPFRHPRPVSDELETTDWRRHMTAAPQQEREPRRDPQEERIAALRKRKETERRERELAMWRQASSPPRLQQTGSSTAPESQATRKYEGTDLQDLQWWLGLSLAP